MKHSRRRLLSIALAMALGATPPSLVNAEDIDLFVGGNPTSAANRPNVIIMIDNSANWNAANQHWVGAGGESPFKQGQSELRALRKAVGEVTDTINLGLTFFTPGSGGGNVDGGYVRYHARQMTSANKAALQELIGDASCVNGPNSLNGTPNCIFKNFSGAEQVATADADYSAAMFEVFKYLGGYTDPANAQTGIAGTPVDKSHFGALRYAGNPDSKSDRFAYLLPDSDANRTSYNPPIDATNNCAKNYVIFIGNGFPNQDSPSTLLSGVQGSTSQLAMPQFTTTSETTNTIIGTSCGTGNNETQRRDNCTANIPQSLKDANPADTYACVGTQINDQTACPGTDNRKFDVQATKTVFTVTPTGTLAVPPSTKARFADEWAKYLYTTDVNGAAGQQNVATYTIDVFKDAQDQDQTALLLSMAKYGGGKYFQASSEEAILDALRQILIEIQAVNSVFAAASLPISATNRSQNENQVFIGMFRPDPDGKPRWYGNLKRYQIALFDQEARLADKDGNDAVSAATGFIQSCAVSFWTTDTTQFDAATPPNDLSYWVFSPISAGQCTLAPPGFSTPRSPFSDLPDGPLVEKGATAEVVRKGNDPAAATPTFLPNRTVYTCANPTASACPDSTATPSQMLAFNTTNVSQSAVGAADATEHTKIVDFVLGKDVNDENANGNVTEVRPSIHGDVAHSRPLPVNYGGSNGVVLFYGANDGTFRAVSGNTGKELWAFVAPDHHSRLKRLTNNSPIIQYPSTPPGVTPTPQLKDYFFDGSAGLFQTFQDPPNETLAKEVWVFPTMRRGGRMLHGFDVSDPLNPKLAWRLGCPNLGDDTNCTVPGIADIGQTWSLPNVAFIEGHITTAPVIVIGGGYDKCEDDDVSTPSCASAKGRKVYVIDARTGVLLKSFDTDRSVTADVTLIDRNFDGLVDHGYVADTGGNLYRIDFVKPGSTTALGVVDWSITKIAFTSGGGRKFQFGPAALGSAGEVFLALGSGDRERPLEINYPFKEPIQNRFYMFRDKFPDPATSTPVDLDLQLTDLTTGSTCSTVLDVNSLGWRFDLNAGRGEQTVTTAVIFGGLVFFSTNRPVPAPPGACAANLGEARGYAVNLLNASGAVGTEAICGAARSGVFVGGGLPPSPVTGVVSIGGKPVTVMIGGIQRAGGASSPIGAQKVKPTITQKRSRIYWYTPGDK